MNAREAILHELAYHDLFDRPLTLHELRLALPSEADPADLLRELETLRAEGRITAAGGFWRLAGRERLDVLRQSRYALAEGKYARVRRFLRLARFAPFLRGAAVCNTLARSNARVESDLDLFVIAEPGRVWLCRLFVTGLAALLGVRPTERVSQDRICLSFFASSDALDLRTVALPGDVYLRHWIRELAPVYEEGACFARMREANRWLPDARWDEAAPLLSIRRRVPAAGAFKRVVETLMAGPIGRRLEAWSKRLQLRLMPERLARPSASSAVVLTDSLLKFHDEDRREEIRARYESALRTLAAAEAPEEQLTAHELPALA